MIIPEIILYRIIDQSLTFLRRDYENKVDKQETFLHHILKGNTLDKMDYLKEGVDLFTRKLDHPRRIKLNMMFNTNALSIPNIHITLPSEGVGQNELNIGEYGHEDYTYINEVKGEVTPMYMRRFESQYGIVCSSDSQNECLLMYRVLQAVLVATLDLLDIEGLQNVKISGNDLRINSDLVPPNISLRAINLQGFHEIQVPRTFASALISSLTTTGNIVIE